MTEFEQMLALAIAPGMVTYVPGTATKRFARDMAWLAEHSPDKALTQKQRKYLLDTVHRYRRQIQPAIVAAAAKASAEPIYDPPLDNPPKVG